MEQVSETERKYIKPSVVAVLAFGDYDYAEGPEIHASSPVGDPDDDHVKEEALMDEDVWEPKNENVWDKAW